MKFDVESKEIKEMDLSKKSDSQHKDDSVENTSIASTSALTTDCNESKEILAKEIASMSKEEVVVKQEDSVVFTTDALAMQNTDSKSEECMVTSTSEFSSLESQQCKELADSNHCSSFILSSAKLEVAPKADESDVCMTDASCLQNSDAALTSNLSSDESCLIEIPSKENLSVAKESKSAFKIEESESHRENIHYSSESSDDETDESSSDSSDCDKFFDDLHKSNGVSTKLPVLTTRGEMLPEDLPPVADLHITVNFTELLKIGTVLHHVISEERNEYFVIVVSDGNSNPLDEDSILFLSADKPLGKIHDVYGNVNKPNYVVRFNKADDIFSKGVTTGQTVYYSPANGELTRYVLVDVLKKQKGSDASWKDNNEPPDDEIDYSDDEQEKLAKQKRRAKIGGKERNWNDDEVEDVTPKKFERRDVAYSQKRAFKRPSRNVFQSSTPSPSRNVFQSSTPGPSRNVFQSSTPGPSRNVFQSSTPGPSRNVFQSSTPGPSRNVFQSSTPGPSRPLSRSQSFGSAPSPPDNFGSGVLRNAISPQPCGPTSSNSIPYQPYLRRNVPSPQPFGPFPQSSAPSPPHFGTFPQSSVSSYKPFTVPPAFALASSNLASSHATYSPQLGPSSPMAAPQNNVPLQQQLLLQSQQPLTTLLSRPPPNYNYHQNSRTLLRQHQSFTPPVFGALPAARPTIQNVANQLSANQMHFSPGPNAPHISSSGNLNISQFTNILPIDSVGYQGQSSNMVQSNTANSYMFPQFPHRSTQHNINSPVTELLVAVHSTLGSLTPPPRPIPPFVPCQTPPPNFLNQPNLSIMSSPQPSNLPSQTPPLPNQNVSTFSGVHPPVLPCQTPPPLPNQNMSFFSNMHQPVSPSQTPPSTVQFCSIPIAGNLFSARNHRPC